MHGRGQKGETPSQIFCHASISIRRNWFRNNYNNMETVQHNVKIVNAFAHHSFLKWNNQNRLMRWNLLLFPALHNIALLWAEAVCIDPKLNWRHYMVVQLISIVARTCTLNQAVNKVHSGYSTAVHIAHWMHLKKVCLAEATGAAEKCNTLQTFPNYNHLFF